MNHYQETFSCGICKREIIIGIISFGVSHQSIKAATCKECAEKAGGKIMKQGEVEEIKYETRNDLSE